MNKKLATALFTLAASFGFAQDALPVIPVDMPVNAKVISDATHSYGYFRLQATDQAVNKEPAILPGYGLGYRYKLNSASVIDVSGTYNGQFDLDKSYYYTVPKASYLRYASPAAETSFYYGAGLAWGGVKRNAVLDVATQTVLLDSIDFQGLVPSATVGAEMGRGQYLKSFVELNVSQPALRIDSYKEASFKNLPRPIAELSIGLGY